MEPVTMALGAISLGSQIFSAFKGGKANRSNERLIQQQEDQNEAFYNNNQNFMDTNVAKSILEKAREGYIERAKLSDSKAAITGASDEAVVAEKSAANKDYNESVRSLAEMGTRYSQQNEFQYRNNLNRLMSLRMGINQQKAQNAGNAAANATDLLSSAAMIGGFGAESGINKDK